ncbi:MAG: DUF3098 domain-containing protein [Bacteroidetes bacterium]|jgi:hypothetical protein|nr:DUF3098 domain-containing protein [Bacteroidota bacterium]
MSKKTNGKKPQVLKTPIGQKATPGHTEKRGHRSPAMQHMPFVRENFVHLGIGIALLIIGYLFMSDDTFTDAAEFSTALYIAPFFTIGGYVYILFAILRGHRKRIGGRGQNEQQEN